MKIAIAIGATFLLFANTPAAAETCRVSDPTGTLLNMRTEPKGRVIAKLRNGQPVRIIEYTVDEGDNGWLLIEMLDARHRRGYVFRNFVSCKR